MRLKSKMLISMTSFLVGILVLSFGEYGYQQISRHISSGSTKSKKDKIESPLFYSQIGESNEGFGFLSFNSPSSKQYTLEFGRVKSEASAKKLISELSRQGFGAFYIPINQGGSVSYLVSYGIFESEEKAQRVASRLQSDSGFSAKVKVLN